jgi:hypothetical protein
LLTTQKIQLKLQENMLQGKTRDGSSFDNALVNNKSTYIFLNRKGVQRK